MIRPKRELSAAEIEQLRQKLLDAYDRRNFVAVMLDAGFASVPMMEQPKPAGPLTDGD